MGRRQKFEKADFENGIALSRTFILESTLDDLLHREVVATDSKKHKYVPNCVGVELRVGLKNLTYH